MYKTVFDFILTLYVKIIKNNIFKINKLIKIKNIFTLYVTYKENNKKKNTYFRPFHVRVPSNLFNKLLGVSQTISPSN